MLGAVVTARTGELLWLFLSLPFTLLLLVMARFAPAGYRLGADGLYVERRMGPKVIRYQDIRSIDRLPRPLGGISMMGSNGVLGRFGHFWNARLGFYRLYVTDKDKVVWLETSRDWVALSPDRPDEFVERLRACLSR